MTSATDFTADLCLKCNLCTAACPVAAVTDLFPGPKAVGPQFQRYRHPRLALEEHSVEWCSGCGVCSRVCPHGVPVTETNIQAKARLASRNPFRVRDWFLARPALLGDLGRPVASLANFLLGNRLARAGMERFLGLAAAAPLPAFRRTTLRRTLRSHLADSPPERRSRAKPVIAYFHGCSTDRYEWEVGTAAVRVLEHLGARVLLPPQGCCGLPLQSNGYFGASRRYARRNARRLRPFLEQGIPLVTTSSSCSLSLKHEQRAILGLEGVEFNLLRDGTWDFFELLEARFEGILDELEFPPIDRTVLYHAPCQLRSHGIGTPAFSVLQRIPGLRLIASAAECCGVAGTYGLKAEQFDVAHKVAAPLLRQIDAEQPDLFLTDSETCRWWIGGLAKIRAIHPVMLLAESLDLGRGRKRSPCR